MAEAALNLCHLCGKEESKQTSISNWNEEYKSFIKRHLPENSAENNEVNPDITVCKKHYLEAKRHHNDSSYVPKWKRRNTEKPLITCMYPQCKNTTINTTIIKARFAPKLKLQEALGIHNRANEDVLLCKNHYNEVYREMNPVKCASCNAWPKKGSMPFNYHSPNAEFVSAYLGDGLSLTPNDLLCKTCYQVHLAILKSSETHPETFTVRLLEDIELWETVIADETTNWLTRAVLLTVVAVGKSLLKEIALLLSDACKIFLDTYCDERYVSTSVYMEVILEMENGTTQFTPRWLLHQLILYLKNYLSFKCIHRKFGTILYKNGGDLLVSLSWALGSKNYQQPFQYSSEQHVLDKSVILDKSACIINDLLHQEISQISSNEDPCNFSIPKFMDNVNPLLTDFLNNATQSVHDKKYSVTKYSSSANHTRLIRQFFIISSIMFCTNPRKPTVFHNILADVVETSGGSRQLLKILNRLGCVCSSDTHDRFVSMHAQNTRELSLWNELSPSVFTIASVDNFDMLQSHSAVHSGNHNRSYHGTTVQLVQPAMYSRTQGQLMTSNNCTNSQSKGILKDLNHRRRPVADSPSTSPHKLGKTSPKRPRTVTVTELPSRTSSTVQETAASLNHYQHLTLEKFQLSTSESEELSQMKSSLFCYMLMKHAFKGDSNNLSDMRKFLKHSSPTHAQASVHYLQMINENPDSEETMLHVAEELLELFRNGAAQKWVVLVGDGKTYQHLSKIKCHYGESLKQLLIFPGDWHTLKTFQNVIMKVYFTAGLQEIAKASEYNGTTLQSLQHCGNFKRTHIFILQVWEALYRVQLEAYIHEHNKQSELDSVFQLIKTAIADDSNPTFLLEKVKSLTVGMANDFYTFTQNKGETDSTWKFWGDFILKNCFAYVSLFLAIRGSNWNLRIASLKEMTPMFAAFDHEVYERIIPNHLADILVYPPEILTCLNSGNFYCAYFR